MIRIAITAAAFDAVASTRPLGSVACEPQVTAKGEWFILDRPACTQATRRLGSLGGERIGG
jgi:hypothetical protein